MSNQEVDLRAAINAISDVVQNRPRPLREFDQIYMKTGDMVIQSELVARWSKDKRLAFIGDGDAISVCVAYLRNGVFLWGIGNSLVPSISLLLESDQLPKVVFSPMLSKPRAVDVAPDRVVRWTKAETLQGVDYILPPASTVTSRFRGSSKHRYHFALVCGSHRKLAFNRSGPEFAMRDLVNVASGRPVGFSQVTAIVRYGPSGGHSSNSTQKYHAAMIVNLVAPYFVRLRFPEPMKTGIDEPFVLTA